MQGPVRVLIIGCCDQTWEPLEVDWSSKHHCLGSEPISGVVIRPAKKISNACCFRLEVPIRGDFSRVYLRSSVKTKDLDAESPSYHVCPYVRFVGDTLCVRHVPSSAVVTNKAAQSRVSNEMLELSLPLSSGLEESELAPKRGDFNSLSESTVASELHKVLSCPSRAVDAGDTCSEHHRSSTSCRLVICSLLARMARQSPTANDSINWWARVLRTTLRQHPTLEPAPRLRHTQAATP